MNRRFNKITDWDKFQEVGEIHSDFPSESGYVDYEVVKAITEADVPTIAVDATFELDYAVPKALKLEGKELVGQRRYIWHSPEGYRLDYFVHHEAGYLIAFGAEKIEKIVGNINSHPFVCTKKFSFVNSDGSTFENGLVHPAIPTPEQVAKLFNEKAQEYLFNQIH